MKHQQTPTSIYINEFPDPWPIKQNQPRSFPYNTRKKPCLG